MDRIHDKKGFDFTGDSADMLTLLKIRVREERSSATPSP